MPNGNLSAVLLVLPAHGRATRAGCIGFPIGVARSRKPIHSGQERLAVSDNAAERKERERESERVREGGRERGSGPKLVRVTRPTLKAAGRAACGLVNTQRTEFANVLNLVGRLEHKPQSNHGSPHSQPPFCSNLRNTLYSLFLSRFIVRAESAGDKHERTTRRAASLSPSYRSIDRSFRSSSKCT